MKGKCECKKFSLNFCIYLSYLLFSIVKFNERYSLKLVYKRDRETQKNDTTNNYFKKILPRFITTLIDNFSTRLFIYKHAI